MEDNKSSPTSQTSPTNKKSLIAKTKRKSVLSVFRGLLKRKEEDFDIRFKHPDNALHISLNMLQLFREMQEIQEKEKAKNQFISRSTNKKVSGIRSPTFAKGLTTTKSDHTEDATISLGNCSKLFMYFILNTTPEEFHESYQKFYSQFDRDDSLLMEENEFISMINYLTKKQNMGKEKV